MKTKKMNLVCPRCGATGDEDNFKHIPTCKYADLTSVEADKV